MAIEMVLIRFDVERVQRAKMQNGQKVKGSFIVFEKVVAGHIFQP